ncbi:MAG: DNA polymerase III subunit gamma/tau [Prevotellaceae bacterium]|jgi:DNA polymerase-3 subunit gamma/tau|nr:DNA polymerase III subunit gamma/tau [Prevotellaceae bacterium]
MDNFVVSARKYRPATFTSVVGQSALTTTLKNAIKSNHLAQAYLFCGPRGVGKTTCARIFAKTINCQNLTPDFEACNECESCVSFNEQRSYNIHELDAASNNGVDDIRTLIDQVRIPPQIGKYSVYIIDEVHMLSAGAFNAFLKTLEEPPSHAVFILATTEKHKIIPTILSRCQIYDFNRITVRDTVEYLQYVAKQENVNIDVNALNIIAQKSDGGMRDALSIFDQIVSFCGKDISYQSVIENLNVLDYDYYFKLTDAFLQGDVNSSLLIFNEVLNKGFDAHQFVTGLSSHFRDLLVSKDAQTIALLEVGADIGEHYKTQAQICSPGFLFQTLKIANDCDLNYRQSKNKRLLVELMLIRLCQLPDEKNNNISSGNDKPPIQKIEVKPQVPALVVEKKEAETQPQAQTQTQPQTQPQTAVAPPVNVKVKENKAPAHASQAPGRISINVREVDKPETVYQQGQKVETALKNSPFTEKELTEAWRKFTKTIPDEVWVVNFINANTPKLTAGTNFEITVTNMLQEKELMKQQSDILSFMQNELNNSLVKMSIKVEENDGNYRSSSPEDIYKSMAAKNPALVKLRSELNLEID